MQMCFLAKPSFILQKAPLHSEIREETYPSCQPPIEGSMKRDVSVSIHR